MKISFVILHYITLNDTIECIESILNNIEYDNYNIIIVDNGSPNNTGVKLQELYKENDKITIILNEENIGFAKGNNLGFEFAKHNKKSDFIVMINNDTIIEQKDFCNKIVDIYIKNKFDIAGPSIISLVDKKNQNPISVQFKNIDDVKNKINKLRILLILNYIGFDVMFQKIKLRLIGEKNKRSNLDDYQLHGSCLIFSSKYINNYDGIYNETFMYCEEDILKFISIRDNLNIKYLHEIKIFHKEDSSTNAEFTKENIKRRFYYKHSIDSCKLLYKLMKSTPNKFLK